VAAYGEIPMAAVTGAVAQATVSSAWRLDSFTAARFVFSLRADSCDHRGRSLRLHRFTWGIRRFRDSMAYAGNVRRLGGDESQGQDAGTDRR